MFEPDQQKCIYCKGTGTQIDSKATGAALRALRLSKHTTLSTVADRLKISKPYLSDLEHGYRNWRPELIDLFIKALR